MIQLLHLRNLSARAMPRIMAEAAAAAATNRINTFANVIRDKFSSTMFPVLNFVIRNTAQNPMIPMGHACQFAARQCRSFQAMPLLPGNGGNGCEDETQKDRAYRIDMTLDRAV